MALPALDDNLDLAVGVTPGQKPDTSRKEIEKLGKAIFDKASSSIQSATKAIIPDVPKMIAQLTTEIEKGPIETFSKSVKKLERLVENLGIDLRDYNEELSNFMIKREETGRKSDETIQKLREQNIIAEKNALNEVHILNKQEIKERQIELKTKQEAVKRVETNIQDMTKRLQTKGNLDKEEQTKLKERIQAQTINLNLLKERNKELKETLDPRGEQGGQDTKQLPLFFESIKAAFLGPFLAVGEAFTQMKENVKNTIEVFSFFTPKGGLAKSFKKISTSLKSFASIFTVARVLLMAKILLVVGAFMFLVSKAKEIGAFIGKILQKIGDVLKGIWTQISDFFKGAINSVIKLINKIPGINIPLLETSKMKEEREDSEKKERIKKGDKQSVGDTGIATESRFEDKGSYLKPKFDEPKGGFSDDAGMDGNTSNIVFNKNTGESMLLNRQVVGDKLKGAGGGTGDASTAEEIARLTRQRGASDTGSPIVINNAPTTVTSQKSGTTVSGYLDNRPDESFMYTRRGSMGSLDF